jgi:choline monooxygenase
LAVARRVSAALPARLYRDPAVLELEQSRIFARTWQLAGHVSRLPHESSYITAEAGVEPVLVLRNDGGELHAFRNVCRHRGSRLLSGSGDCGKAIRCRYHGWTYRFDGDLIGVPEGRSISGLDKSALALFPARVEELSGLVFVNLDIHATPLVELVAGLRERLDRYGLEQLRVREEAPVSQPANWKIVVDNYLEGYHIPIGHPGLMRLLDYKRYEVELHDNWLWYDAPLRGTPSGNRMERIYQRLVEPMPGLAEEDRRVWHYVFIYPNTMIDLYPDQVAVWRINPDGTRRTADLAFTLLPRQAGLRTRFAQYANRRVNLRVAREDVDLVANQQAGLETRGFSPGPLSRREAALGWFADKVRADLDDGA